jgi:hypothetical protein
LAGLQGLLKHSPLLLESDAKLLNLLLLRRKLLFEKLDFLGWRTFATAGLWPSGGSSRRPGSILLL